MRVSALFSTLLAAAAVASAESVVASIFIQPITTPETPPSLLAEVSYEAQPETTAIGEVLSYEAPDLPEGGAAALVRVGVYDAAAARWVSSTSVASADNFGKGLSPHLVLSVDNSKGQILGVLCKGVRIDAGQTRDFGPQVVVVPTARGKHPDLNRPVVLSPEGKNVVPEEKTLLQKYWWVLAIGVFVLVSGGGDSK
ncbi:hypothetical protein B0T24DRAFT_334796 [Lasiosphaeria ovina]|uniref:Cyclin-dependent protein kinase regulator pho80 n=1 Tax=Lasiosphaeria ovina TaxID=92902 RepID=A0AAE0K957_9PEZI|nr:hypothetical protein B0T24DRAFT_334796 [Lasiosphaeria ovina]